MYQLHFNDNNHNKTIKTLEDSMKAIKIPKLQFSKMNLEEGDLGKELKESFGDIFFFVSDSVDKLEVNGFDAETRKQIIELLETLSGLLNKKEATNE